MSGHSKWASIKHKKAAIDAKRGKMFSRIAKEITVAAKNGGDINNNPRLRTAVTQAKAVNMPADNIKKAIQKGTGELPGVSYEEIRYEGYGPGGVALIIDLLTDNKNRVASEIRSIFTKKGGNLAATNAVAWMFHRKGIFTIDETKSDEDTLFSIAMNAGAEDIKHEEGYFEIITQPDDFAPVQEALAAAGIACSGAELTLIPENYVSLEQSAARTAMGLIEALEEHDDVQNVYTNLDVPDDMVE